MLQKATSGIFAPVRGISWRRGLLSGPTSLLVKYVVIAAAVTAIGCLYLWQTNSLRELQVRTDELREVAVQLEQDNVNLVNQLALWSTPVYVDRRAGESGYVSTQPRLVVTVPDSEQRVAQAAASSPDTTR